MLILNNKYFGKLGKHGYDSPEPVSGLYKVNKKSITLYDLNENKCGVIVNGVMGKATRLESGKWWYNYMMPAVVGDYDDPGLYRADVDKAMKLIRG